MRPEDKKGWKAQGFKAAQLLIPLALLGVAIWIESARPYAPGIFLVLLMTWIFGALCSPGVKA